MLAVTIDISNCPTTISTDPFNVDVSISGPNDGKNYLRIDFYKEGTTNYFGETYNGSDWYSESTGTNYFPIDIVNSTAFATLQGRVGTPLSTEYSGSGTYKLRIRRYTASGGSQASKDQQTPVDVNIQVSTPTPTPTNNPTTSSTQTSSPTSTSAKTSSPIPVATKTPTPKSTKTPSPTSTNDSSEVEVLGIQMQDESPNSSPQEESTEKSKVNFLPFIFIVLGISFVGFAGFAFFKQKGLNNNESEKGKEII